MEQLNRVETASDTEQLTLMSYQDVLEVQDPDQLRELRSYLFRVAQANIDLAYEITDRLVADEEEPKSRRKRVRLFEVASA